MFSEKLVEPVSEAAPAGEAGLHTLALQQLASLTDYLAARLEVEELERNARRPFEGENAKSDEVAANASLDDGRRKLARLESAAKEVTGRAARPDFVQAEVSRRAEKFLLESGKDLLVVQHMALAWLLERGVEGLQDALRLVCELVDRFGAELHPRPDEDDPTDLSAREIAVSEVLNGEAFLSALRETTLLEVQGVGRFSCRDAEVIDGRLAEDNSGGVRNLAGLKGLALALAQSSGTQPAAALAAVSSSIDQCLDAAGQVLKRLDMQAASGDRVLKLLERCRTLLTSATKELVSEASASRNEAEGDSGPGVGVAGTEPGDRRPKGEFGALRTRDDARRQILEISRFLEATEPSHPAPLFLRRAERLLGAKDFFAIMRDMAPDSVHDLQQRITGFGESTSDTQ
ncbi:MAG: type VI secretion system ImpA family N-terminal domain-containing protein [Burkholderiales bacterium]|nr:type VI secretion system ImpA family N-terminal domain-containing protein [Burkholderiales bacterium]